ncbi:MAG TPA: hypothetical protein PKY30_23465, partial [Myxococcota bacterium]|nr:hypothetical protein [Myxococcota bacterium]
LWVLAPGAWLVALPAWVGWARRQSFRPFILLWGVDCLGAGVVWTLRPEFARLLYDLRAAASLYPPVLNGFFSGLPVVAVAVGALLLRPAASLSWAVQALVSLMIALYLGKGMPAPETVPLLLLVRTALPLLDWRRALLLFAALLLWSRAPQPAAVAPQYTGAADQPGEQSLFLWENGQERGPLLEAVSSAEVWHSADGWSMWFVRHDAEGRPKILESHSPDGEHWESPTEIGIEGYDPARIVDASGKEWLLVVQSLEQRVDPARAQTRLLRYQRGAAGWEEEAVLLQGVGLVDPAPRIREDGSWELYYTAPPTTIRRALSPDGRIFTPEKNFVVLDTTVPAWIGGRLLAQRHVRAKSQLFRLEEGWVPLGICGTGVTGTAQRLYYSRGKGGC